MTAYVRLELEPADLSIEDAGAEMAAVTRKLGLPTMASFNGVWLQAELGDTDRDIVRLYDDEIRYRRMAEQMLADETS